MLFIGLDNFLQKGFISCQIPYAKVLRNSFSDILIFENDFYWGKKYLGLEVVKYFKFKIYEKISLYDLFLNFSDKNFYVNCLSEYFYNSKKFEYDKESNSFYPIIVGRNIIETGDKKIIIDIVFNDYYNKFLTKEQIFNYSLNNSGAVYSWYYNINDSNMTNFVMKNIEKIPESERTQLNIVIYMAYNLHSENGLIEGKWNTNFDEKTTPLRWKNPQHIFLENFLTKKRVKYGQCWCFAECFTVCMRFLNIPSVTNYSNFSRVNFKNDKYIDFFKDDNSKDTNNCFHIQNTLKFLHDTFCGEKNDNNENEIENVKKFDDSYWNIHYWCKIFIYNENSYDFYYYDVTPLMKENLEVINGPCRISSLKNVIEEKYDFNFLFSSINAPLRIWVKEYVFHKDKYICIPILRSIIFRDENLNIITNSNDKSFVSKNTVIYENFNNNKTELFDYFCNSKKHLQYLFSDSIIFFNSNTIKIKNEKNNYIQICIFNKNGSISKILIFENNEDLVFEYKIDEDNDYVCSILVLNSLHFEARIIQLKI